MKKLVLSTLLFGFWFSPAQAIDRYGFYAGIDATGTLWHLQSDLTFEKPFNVSNVNYDDTGWDFSAMGRFGTYVRWGWRDRFFTALELIGQPNDLYFIHDEAIGIAVVDESDFFIQTAEASYSLGGQFKQGYLFLENFLGYLTVGSVYTQYKLSTNYFNIEIPDYSAQVSQEDKFFLPGLRLGLGMELFVTDHIGVDGQVAYTWYQDKEISLINENYQSTIILVPVGELSFNPSALQLGVGFNIYF
jgi:opacity protein-like surface antigen